MDLFPIINEAFVERAGEAFELCSNYRLNVPNFVVVVVVALPRRTDLIRCVFLYIYQNVNNDNLR